jgi:hypothetical protein
LSKTKQERDSENNLHTTEYARAGNQKYYINANYAIKKIETWDGKPYKHSCSRSVLIKLK